MHVAFQRSAGEHVVFRWPLLCLICVDWFAILSKAPTSLLFINSNTGLVLVTCALGPVSDICALGLVSVTCALMLHTPLCLQHSLAKAAPWGQARPLLKACHHYLRSSAWSRGWKIWTTLPWLHLQMWWVGHAVWNSTGNGTDAQ